MNRNPLTGVPAVVAPGRARRPGASAAATAPECPLCEGHEAMTPPELLALGRAPNAAADSPGWGVRVVPNKYPAIEGQEVIVHAAAHTPRFTQLPAGQRPLIARAWRSRLDAGVANGAAWVLLGINEGRPAGASLEHSHSQIVPFADVPPVPAASAPALTAAACALCAALQSERSRVVWQGDGLVAFCPAWSRFAREIWVVPQAHDPRIPGDPSLADAVTTLVSALERHVAADVAWNMVVHEAPAGITDHHWHAEILPRTAVPATVELGAGVWVDAVDPDAAAAELRVV